MSDIEQLVDCLNGRDDKKAFACYEELEEISKDSNESKKTIALNEP